MNTEKQVDLNKEVFNKSQYSNTIDTLFQELGVKTINEEIEEEISVDKFFGDYNTLFYDIPALGETNSHEFLIKTSSEYNKFEDNNIEIEALRLEISNLRQNLLNEQIKNLELTTGKKIKTGQLNQLNINVDEELDKIIG